MTLWLIAAGLGAVLLAAVAFLVMRRQEEGSGWEGPRHSHPWDRRPEEPAGSRLASLAPPAAGVLPPAMMTDSLQSLEIPLDDDEDTGPVPTFDLETAGLTDQGKKRKHNEDAFLIDEARGLVAVADGMGGYAAGEVAAALALETLRLTFETETFGELEEGYPRRGAELVDAIRRANLTVREEAARDPQKAGMGTTFVGARFYPRRSRAYIAHVGDSRCYRLRRDIFEQLTEDHTLGAVGITGPSAGKLSRAVGVFDDVEVELQVDEPVPDDIYLFCSDGLYKMVPEANIEIILRSTPDLHAACRALVDAANERGGRDNVTVALVRVAPIV